MNLIDITQRMREVADTLDRPCTKTELKAIAASLRDLADMVPRRRPSPPAPDTSEPITPAMVKQARFLRQQHPGMKQAEIARILSVNPGRISEMLNDVSADA